MEAPDSDEEDMPRLGVAAMKKKNEAKALGKILAKELDELIR